MSHYRGICNGGPMHGAPMTHHGYAYRLAYYVRNPQRAIVGMVSSSDPEIAFGVYHFDPEHEVWQWREAAEPATGKTELARAVTRDKRDGA